MATKRVKTSSADTARTSPVLTQIKSVWRNKLAAIVGLIIGGAIPALTYALAHHQANGQKALWILVFGGLVYSSTTIYDWMMLATARWYKSAGFVVILEGVMTFADGKPAKASLAILVLINAFAFAYALVVGNKPARKKK